MGTTCHPLALAGLGVLLASSAVLAGAPYRDAPSRTGLSGIVLNPGTSFNRGISPLFDPSRTQWSHSLSYGMASGGGGSVGQGLFMNSMDMRLGQRTDFKLHMGVLNTTYNSYNPAATGSDLVGGAEFMWSPTDNLHLQVGVFRGMGSPTTPWSPWSGSSGLGYSGFRGGE
ncbi:MAG: hypothetical protein KDC10_15270 [Calditrichaeota bacterium]|nr:hypothetical protein [Candidatus Cloacimonadota bacterium]MCA9786159.1 hypothetical protein [Candidatus Cloacimonadota bacterium]MCB1048556.1 hypothetical protein [Calditrichota bacterium]MCB9472989.1 hypothetical protein [Candidatus Delongbacteria bacterium]